MGRKFHRYVRKTKRRLRRAKRRLKKRALYPVYAFILLVISAYIAFPKESNRFLWLYFKKPMVLYAQSTDGSGIFALYNPINTMTYLVLLIASVRITHSYLKKHRISFDKRVIEASIPFVLGLGVLMAVAKYDIVKEPMTYFLLSPFVYIWGAILWLFLFLYSEFLERRNEYEAMVLSVLPYPIIVRVFWLISNYSGAISGFTWFIPIILVYSFFHIYISKTGFERDSSLFLYSMFFLTMAIPYLTYAFSFYGISLSLFLIPIILSFSLYALVLFLEKSISVLSKYDAGHVNSILLFSQTLFGVSIGFRVYYIYMKESPINNLMYSSSMALIISVILVLLTMLFIDILDFHYSDKFDDISRNLVKFAVIFLLLSAGTSEILAISMGL
jgi:uncharacterized membrane protein